MKEQTIRESIFRLFIADINSNLKSVEEEIVKMSNKISKRQMNGLLVNKIINEMDAFDRNFLTKRNRIEFLKIKNNINNYLNDMLVD